jgi:putative acyl-CoA dehydrogenase
MWQTHDVRNQVPLASGYNAFASDSALQALLRHWAPQLDTQALHRWGELLSAPDWQTQARLANSHKPVLQTHSALGERIDRVEFHPAYHALLGQAMQAGLHASAWAQQAAGHPHAHLQRGVLFSLFSGLEPSVLCPISMTYAVMPALRGNPAIFADWQAGLVSQQYDARERLWRDKTALTMGMGMTEKQGGSDVRANSTRAVFDGHDAWGERCSITGHKWFFSAPMSDAWLILAQEDAGLSCFFLPRILPGGLRNAIAVQRLKDKLGNTANASSEVEFQDAIAWRVGPAGRGVAQILEMGTMTRLDCALGTAGLMRQALVLALHHARERFAFGKRLNEHAAMQNVLADLAMESEAATALALRLAHAFDRQNQDPHEALLARVLTPVAKFWVCKRGSLFAQEAMECLGGSGYVEEGGQGIMARIYREMPLNSIWEGAGNIMALDLLRALRKGDVAAALAQELAPVLRAHPAMAPMWQNVQLQLQDATEASARRLARDVAVLLQAGILLRTAPDFVASAFCDSRLASAEMGCFGALPQRVDAAAIVQRAWAG